jgi:subfamily B ATP-binding cassette protein MsbA
MKRILRLLGYMKPYAFYTTVSVALMAVVGALAAFRILLIKFILDNVLSSNPSPDKVLVFPIPHTQRVIDLQYLIPHHFHNAWTVVTVALVGSAIIKSFCDYLGTLMANKAGFGMITDIRNDLYNAILGRSTAFYQRHPSGKLISALINDVERVQSAMSTVFGDFLQQFFTLIFMIGVVVLSGGRLSWVLLIFVPVIVISTRRVGRNVRKTTRRGQDKLAEIQSVLQQLSTGSGCEPGDIPLHRRAG